MFSNPDFFRNFSHSLSLSCSDLKGKKPTWHEEGVSCLHKRGDHSKAVLTPC